MRSEAAERVRRFQRSFIKAPARVRPQVIERAAPGLVANVYCPETPHPKQLAGHVAANGHDDKLGPFEMLFGGAAGGGKSSWLLQAVAARAAAWGHYRGVILRRTHAEMMKSGAILSRAMRWWLPLRVHWDGTNKTFRFPSGATVEFGYHDHPTHDAKFQGGEWHDALFDELTHWHDDGAFEWLRSRLRTGEGDPIGRRLLATSNPGGAGHQWVKERFVGGKEIGGRLIVPRSYYLPSRISDNPSLDRDAYTATLQDMHPTRRAQLLDGDWSAREPGDYFRLEWFGPLLDEAPTRECVAVRWWDLAASEKESAARTAGVRMVRIVSGVRVVTHATAFRATPGKRDAKIVAQAKLDGRGTVVGIEIEPGSGGIAQFDALAMRLRADGFRVVGARPNAKLPEQTRDEKVALAINTPSDKGKAARADPVASCLERGHQRRGECEDTGAPWWGVDGGRELYGQRDGLRIVAGDWSQGYLDELEGFPEAKLKDLVDATSGAWAWLQAHPFGRSRAPVIPKRTAASQSQDAHPDDRPEPGTEDRSPGGHWRP
jgi:phage terminase large subunit-like protein